MSAIGTIFSGPLAQAIGWALLHLLWQGVLVAAILAATLALLRRQTANARYLASCGALLVIVMLSFVTAYRAYDPLVTVSASQQAAWPAGAAVEFTPATFAMTGDVMTPAAGDRLAALGALASSHLSQIVLVWLIGVTLLAARLIAGWVGATRLAARYARPAEPQWERAMHRIADALRLRRTIRLLESAAVEVPTVIGWLRPVVLLPVATLSGLSTEQIEMILAHELAHIRRHDFIVNLLQSTVETLFFYQPAVWWISRRIRVEREHCCDDLAVAVCGDPIRYARALTRFEELRIDAAQTMLAASGGSLLGRIRRLVVAHGESANWSSRWAAGAALLTVVAALVISPSLPLFAQNEPAPPPPPAVAAAHGSIEVTEAEAVPDPDPDCDLSGIDLDVDVDVDPEISIDIEDIEDLEDMGDDAIAIAVAPGAPVRPGRVRAVPVRPGRVRAVIAPMVAPRIQSMIGTAMAPTAPMIAAAIAAGVPGGIEGGIAGGISGLLDSGDDIDATDRKFDEKGKLSVDDLIALRSAGVTPKYIEEMRAMGLGNLTLNQLVAMRVQGVSPEYIRGLRAAGVDVTSPKAVIAMRIQGVTGDYISGMRAAGYDKLTTDELVAMRVQGVTARYVKDMADAGYKHLSAKDLIALRIHGVNSEFVKALAEAGYTNLSAKDLSRLAASGVNAEFIRDLAKYRTK